MIRGRKGHYRELFEDIRKRGYLKVRVDGEIKDLVPKMQVDRYKIHDIEVVIDRLAVTERYESEVEPEYSESIANRKGFNVFVIERQQ